MLLDAFLSAVDYALDLPERDYSATETMLAEAMLADLCVGHSSGETCNIIYSYLCQHGFRQHGFHAPEDYWEMAQAATRASFPFDTWRANLLEAFGK